MINTTKLTIKKRIEIKLFEKMIWIASLMAISFYHFVLAIMQTKIESFQFTTTTQCMRYLEKQRDYLVFSVKFFLSHSEVCIHLIHFYYSLLNKFLKIMKKKNYTFYCGHYYWSQLEEAHCCLVGCFEWSMPGTSEVVLHHCHGIKILFIMKFLNDN